MNRIYKETFHLKFSYINAWFTDQNPVPLEIEERRKFDSGY